MATIYSEDTAESQEATDMVLRWLRAGQTPEHVLSTLALLYVGTGLMFHIPLHALREAVTEAHHRFTTEAPYRVVPILDEEPQ